MATYLDVNLVTTEDNGDVLANTLKVAMPIWHVLIRDTGSDVEHDNTTLSLNVVSIAQTTELLLSCRVPHIEADGSEVGRESKRVDFDTKGS